MRLIVLIFTILCLFANFSNADIVASYTIEDGSGSCTGDLSGFGNNADFAGQPQWVSSYDSNVSSYALQFSGNDYLVVEDSTSLDSISGGFTLTAWINAQQDSLTNVIVWKVGAFKIWKQNANLLVSLDGVPNVTSYQILSGEIINNQWQHIAVTYDGRYIAGYIDGVRKKRIRVNDNVISLSSSNYPLRIGWSGDITNYSGLLDNVKLYNSALSSTEVIEDMTSNGLLISQPITVVNNSTVETAIIKPDNCSEVADAAAEELQYHIAESTGETLTIYTESNEPTGYAGLIYVGPCAATIEAGIDGSLLDDNGYVVRSVGADLFLTGQDSSGAVFGMLHLNKTRIGTLLAVYRFLENYMDVKWLWPGINGEVIPLQSSLVFQDINIIGKPTVPTTRLIDSSLWNWGAASDGWASSAAREGFLNDQSKWMRRQGFCQVDDLEYSHSFSDWWDNYNVSHPEFFNLLPDGTRRPDPLCWNGWDDLVGMCMAEPNLQQEIVDGWVNSGDPTRWINCSMNDAATKCTDARCMAWDVLDTDLTIPWVDRLTYATNAFNANESDWYEYLGNMSDRYAKFILAIQQQAIARGYSDATVIGYAYDNRNKGPVQTQLNENVVIGIVPSLGEHTLYFPWTDESQWQFRRQWSRWTEFAGARAFLRPNYFLTGHNMPIFIAKRFGQDFIYALRRKMFATMFDSLTGQWGTQGPNLYMLARVQTHVASDKPWGEDIDGDCFVNINDLAIMLQHWLDSTDCLLSDNYCDDMNQDGNINLYDFAELSNAMGSGCDEVQAILNEFYSAFGPAENAVRAYFEHWENVSENVNIVTKWNEFYKTAPQIFTSSVMTDGRNLLTAAQQAATGNVIAEKLVNFLDKGLTNVELTLEAQTAWENYQQTGIISSWTIAINALDAYRASIENEGICNMGYLYWAEEFNWVR